ncbi:SMI1/KNR4 family protein [Myxococcota bacterium]|nr:SMI1/KNR4 family protein [Myxococcota bacterium]MBU1511122.1 SMI1/KNR4 family protein [Myxococcota bacterium]
MTFETYLKKLGVLFVEQGYGLDLRPPASEAQIAALEASLGLVLDPALRTAWQVADGSQTGISLFTRHGFLENFDFLSVDEVLEERRSWAAMARRYAGYAEPVPRDERIAAGWFLPEWVPFARFGGGELILMQDHAPSNPGQAGQIIAFVHDPDTMEYVAKNFDGFLQGSLETILEDPEEFFFSFDA